LLKTCHAGATRAPDDGLADITALTAAAQQSLRAARPYPGAALLI